jgi:hypothetical protein
MNKVLVALAFTIVCALPARGQAPPVNKATDECTALWKDFDEDEDDALSDAEAARLKGILAVIDTNKDGTVSKAEFMAACQAGLLKDVKK